MVLNVRAIVFVIFSFIWLKGILAASNCTLKVVLNDVGGDSWNSNYLAFQTGEKTLQLIDRNGDLVSRGTLSYGAQETFSLNVLDGQLVSYTYHPVGKWQTENMWEIHHELSPVIISEGNGTNSEVTGQFLVRCCCAPEKVTNVIIRRDTVPYYATLTWPQVNGAVAYIVSRKVATASFEAFGEYTETNLKLFLSPSTTYQFQVQAINNYTHGPTSDTVTLTTTKFPTCSITVGLFDNFDDELNQENAHLAIVVGDGVGCFRPFSGKSSISTFQIPSSGEFPLTATIVTADDMTEDFEYVLHARKKEFLHCGGRNYTNDNTMIISCAMVNHSLTENLLRVYPHRLLTNEKSNILNATSEINSTSERRSGGRMGLFACPTNCRSLNRNICQNTFRPLTCGTCLTGYSATGATRANTLCTDINECSSGNRCSPNARCTNTVGSFTCTCNTGYIGNGVTCQLSVSTTCGQSIRREWFSLTPQQQDQWIRAVNLLYHQHSAVYQSFISLHNREAPFAHGTPSFLPWHRPYLSMWEDALRSLGGEFACITQPYWDWTNTQKVQSIFTNALKGGYRIGVGVKDGNCFTGAHPFAGYTVNGKCVSRSVMTTSRFPSAWALASQLSTPLFSQARQAIESVHNTVHLWVGGTMAFIGISPSDPAFFLHHAQVDQLWAAWEMCHGYATLNLNPLPANLNIPWDATVGAAVFTSPMPGWPNFSPRDVFNLFNTFNVKYERTWLTNAFSGATTFSCPAGNQVWLASEKSESKMGKHLLTVPSSKKVQRIFRRNRNAFQPTPIYLAEQQSVYEAYKESYLQNHNSTVALNKAWYLSCSSLPPLTEAQAQLFTPEFIHMMHFEEECRQGYCVDLCWKIMHTNVSVSHP